MANVTAKEARDVRGVDPQTLVEKIIRERVYVRGEGEGERRERQVVAAHAQAQLLLLLLLLRLAVSSGACVACPAVSGGALQGGQG